MRFYVHPRRMRDDEVRGLALTESVRTGSWKRWKKIEDRGKNSSWHLIRD